MAWLYPAALVGLAAIVGPVLVHLLRRQRARTLVVPTIRFVPAADRSIVRMRLPTDLWLLLLRVAIVACAALALAQPLVLTDARAAAWSDRIARVVVVDRTESAEVGEEAIVGHLASATFPHRIDATDLPAALRRAAAWLDASPPARREIVVLSDFQRGTLAAHDLEAVPKGLGLRFVSQAADARPGRREVTAPAVLSGPNSWQPQVRIDEATTSVTYARLGGAQAVDGLRLMTAPQDEKAAASLVRIVSRAGAHAPDPSEPVVVRFPGGGPLPPAAAAPPEWVSRAALRLLQAADSAGLPLSVLAGADALLVDVAAAPDTLAAAEAVKAALDARVNPGTLAEQEVARIPANTLNSWAREAAPADPAMWQRADESDARWLWLAALILLGAEGLARRTTASVKREEHARAA